MASIHSPDRTVPMREWITGSIGDLFYQHGTSRSGVEDIVRHLKITRSTLYRHFRGKEGLIIAYLKHRDAFVRAELEAIAAQKTGTDAIRAVFKSLETRTQRDAFRGCSFLVAAAENPGSNAIREAARDHKIFLQALFSRLVPNGPLHETLTEQLLVLYEGALAGSVLRPEAIPAQAALKATETLLRSAFPQDDQAGREA